MADEKVGIEIGIDGSKANQQLGSIRAQIKAATVSVVEAQQKFGDYSKQALDAAKKLAILKERIQEASETAALFDPGKKFQAVTGTIQAMAGAFSAAQGAIGLMGVESKEVEKAILKVQSAMALSQGLSTIADSAKDFQRLGAIIKTQVVSAFSTLKGAIAATGLGVLAIALGYLVTNFDEVKKMLTKLIPGFSEFAKVVGGIIEKFTDFVGVTSEADRALAKLDKTSARRKEGLEGELKLLEASGASEKQLSETRKQIINEDLNRLRAKSKIGEGLSTEEQKQFRELKTNLLVEDAKYAKTSKDNQKKAGDEAEKARQERIDREIEQEQKKIDRLFELSKIGGSDYERKVADLKAQYDADLKLFGDSESAKAFAKAQYDQAVFEATKAEKERLRDLDDGYADKKIKDLEKAGDSQKASTQKTTDLITAAMNKSLKKRGEDEVKITKLTQDEKLNIVSNAVQMGIKIAGEGSVVGKALAIADATINTYAGANRALKELPPPFSYIAAATTIAAGLLNVQQILQTEIPSTAGVSDTSGGGSIGGAPPMQPRPEAAVPTELGAASLNTISNVVARAYVVESDITGSQQRINRIQNAARF